MAMICENFCNWRSNRGRCGRTANNVALSTRKAVASICVTARVGVVRNPAIRGMPMNPSFPIRPTSTHFPSGKTLRMEIKPVSQKYADFKLSPGSCST
jgi:hypothetical protein